MPTPQIVLSPTRQPEETSRGARIKVVGVGGGGSNAINRMIDFGVEGVEFIALNTDIQSLEVSKAPVRRQLGSLLTYGLGAGSDPDTGRRAAIQNAAEIAEVLEGANMVFITAGLGGGTGTGAAPVIAAIASEMGALTVAIVTRPFNFEGKRRMAIADWGIEHLLRYIDTLIVIPNEKLLDIAKDAPFFESFRIADDFLRQAVQGISDIITTGGVINRDFADVKTIMAGMGYAVMGTAWRSGPTRAMEAVMAAMASPLLEAGAIDGARGILINITGSSSLRLCEVNAASTFIQSVAHEDANIIFGAVLDERLGDEVKVTVIATGLRGNGRNRSEPYARPLRSTRPQSPANPPIEPASNLAAPITIDAAPPLQLAQDAYPEAPQPLIEAQPASVEETKHSVQQSEGPARIFTNASLTKDNAAASATLPEIAVHLELSEEQQWRDAIREIARLAEPHTGHGDHDPPALERAVPTSTAASPMLLRTDEAYTLQPERDLDPGEDLDTGLNSSPPFDAVDEDAPPQSLTVSSRHMAIATYSATPPLESPPSISTPSTAFAEIFAARRRFAEDLERHLPPAIPQSHLGTIYSDQVDEVDDRHVRLKPSGRSTRGDDHGQSVFSGKVQAQTPIFETTLPISPVQPADAMQRESEKFSNAPLFQRTIAAADSAPPPVRLEAQDIPKPLPEFNRRLKRDNGVDRTWERVQVSPGRQDRLPSFASVTEDEPFNEDPDELDIPAFLRRGN